MENSMKVPQKLKKQNYHLVHQSHLWYVSKGIPHTKNLQNINIPTSE